jgi:hypothetical protein
MSWLSRIRPSALDTATRPTHFKGPFGVGMIVSRPAAAEHPVSGARDATPPSTKPICLCVPSQ